MIGQVDQPHLYVGLGIIVLAPLALVLLAWRGRRPTLYAPAGAICLGASPLLWSAMPLLAVPGVLFLRAFAKRSPTIDARRATAILAPIALSVVAWALLFSNTSQHCRSDENGYSCSDQPSATRTALSVAVAVAGVGAGWVLAAPQPGPERAMAASSVPR